MSDHLIKRLRDIANDQTYCNGRMCAAESTLDEAADEIERLQSRIDALHEHDGTMCPICAMENEIERLREEVKRLQIEWTDAEIDWQRREENLKAEIERLRAPDADHPDAMECPMCDNITLVPAEDEHSQDWTCTHCGAQVSFA